MANERGRETGVSLPKLQTAKMDSYASKGKDREGCLRSTVTNKGPCLFRTGQCPEDVGHSSDLSLNPGRQNNRDFRATDVDGRTVYPSSSERSSTVVPRHTSRARYQSHDRY